MKKIYILTLVTLVMAASCSKDQITALQQDDSISFRMVLDKQTRATSYTSSSLTSFNVTAWLDGGTVPYIDQEDFDRASDGSFASASNYHWPSAGSLYFYAYAPKASNSNGITYVDEITYDVEPVADTDSQVDFLFAKNSGDKTNNASSGVELNFRHAMSKIYIMVKNSNPNVRFNVTGWKIVGVDGSATFTFDDAISNTSSAALNSANTFGCDLWTDNDDDYTAKYIKSFAAKSVTEVNSTWGALDGSAILIPQAAPGATCYLGSQPTGNPMDGAYIAIQYDALNAYSGRSISNGTIWGCWPISFDWNPGFRYNYTVDLAQFGYEETGVDDLVAIDDDYSYIKFANVTVDKWQPEIDESELASGFSDPCLRFHTEGGLQTLYIEKTQGNASSTKLEYSIDEGKTWTELLFKDGDANGVLFGDLGNIKRDVLVRGNEGFQNCAESYREDFKTFCFSDPNQLVDCTGNVCALSDYVNPESYVLIEDGHYAKLFENCVCLRTAPELPAMALSHRCYYAMFRGCTNLLAAPELPATTFGYNGECYAYMFENCTRLVSGPSSLPATELSDMCYQSMFSGCTSLTRAPLFPTSQISCDDSSCQYMFKDCASLVSAPALPAMTAAYQCFSGMFSGCTSLTQAPDLYAIDLTDCDWCYKYMFEGCTSLTTAPTIYATTLCFECCFHMFSGCTSLTTVPAFRATTLATGCYQMMFNGCTALTTAPALPVTTLARSCYRRMFNGCTSLTAAPELPANVMDADCYSGMFQGCSSLTNAPALPAQTLALDCYCDMFKDCTSLATAPELPATTLANYCYCSMFEGCTSLTTSPVLNAASVPFSAYSKMFYGCSSLNLVYAYFTSVKDDSLDSWLDGTASSGVLYKYYLSDLPRSKYNLPSGWNLWS